MLPLVTSFALLALLQVTYAATANDWRSRSVYQVVTDRFAANNNPPCDLSAKKYCGGTYPAIQAKLDYIQGMGFDAVWISPTAKQIGPTPYGDPYHGYWPVDWTQSNTQFGSDDDLKALSAELHRRGMYLMVDLPVNAAASLSTDISAAALAADDGGTLLFKNTANYHPAMNINYGNHTSEQFGWLSTSAVALMDLANETPAVANVLNQWVSGYVKQFQIDGFRLDASKHMGLPFQNALCKAAGILCMGEIYGSDVNYACSFQGSQGIDSVEGFGLMYGLTGCFGDNPKSMNTLFYYINETNSYCPDPTATSVFLDNQDLARVFSFTSDSQRAFNMITGMMLTAGFPTVYYGTEQELNQGKYDPFNREALWQTGYSTTTATYKNFALLNTIRKHLGRKSASFWTTATHVIATQTQDIAWTRPGCLVVLTNRGASGTGTWTVKNTGLGNSQNVIDLLSCATAKTGADGSLVIVWKNGQPYIWVTLSTAAGSGLCGTSGNLAVESTGSLSSSSDSSSWSTISSATTSSIFSTSSASDSDLTVNPTPSTLSDQWSDTSSPSSPSSSSWWSSADTGAPTTSSTSGSTGTTGTTDPNGQGGNGGQGGQDDVNTGASPSSHSSATGTGKVTTSTGGSGGSGNSGTGSLTGGACGRTQKWLVLTILSILTAVMMIA
ncbi:hypothetical protein TREMEDRAFT_73072 [Tremella mesenterica DSM 1558]|uniref:uncharacterized protein n=1 Tax=Tremella mesenterica (strain ATCC 24925 / CBS 8224 / DSM 1558 / NBRC 9311 / NRRL Y-6157 / RJB 2259-6 / UBC 559-6) TaxID=578456 RepID=UPI0003F492AF|nr:uncharacterized protein TREMEDRAFT_73072 [Tremella mesenterica DSM 1558]EIW73436.1 hypothetical protein TREMEDRAFT_73072 [Tremella mesenterica DSM 1558]